MQKPCKVSQDINLLVGAFQTGYTCTHVIIESYLLHAQLLVGNLLVILHQAKANRVNDSQRHWSQ